MPDIFDTVIRIAAIPIALIFLFNGIDDLFVDLNFYLRGLWRRKNRITAERLKALPQKRIALLVPAWREADVIEQMLENTLSSVDYDPTRFDVFVGTYANDPETQAKVDSIAARVPNVIKVVVPHDGPTCKADCLNWIYQGILLAEGRRGARYDILAMHDSEDVVHPLELRLFNYHIPAYDFVQTPVLPLEVSWYSLIGGTYLDDFTENHLKDMLVRARLGGLVPSAGVGSAFARDAFEEIALAHSQEAFDPSSLTEDYEIGVKFRLAGKKTLFACDAIERTREITDPRGRTWKISTDEYIATREFFPTTFMATVRQRSRWILGIDFQAWEKIGWQGPLAVRYCLWRDRKAMLSHVASIAGYGIIVYVVTRFVIGAITGHQWTFERIFPLGSFLWWSIMINGVLLLWRWTVRFMTVDKVYGPLQAFMSVVRLPLGNVVNFFALLRAFRQWVHHKISGRPLRWASTAHTFPTTAALAAYHRRLGEILVDREGLSRADLARALELQSRSGEPLGEVLTMSGAVTEQQVTRALSTQWSIPVVQPDPAAIPLSLLERLPEAEAEEMGVLPICIEHGIAHVAVSHPPGSHIRDRLEARLGMRIWVACASEAEIVHARERAYRRLAGIDHARHLGEMLVSHGLLTPNALSLALDAQRQTGELLGELLLRSRLVKPEQIAAVAEGFLHGGFRAVAPDEGDPYALRVLGFGFCALHSMLPVRGKEPGAPAAVVSAFPLHPSVRARIDERLGRLTACVQGPTSDIVVALHLAARSAWPLGIIAGIGGADGSELEAARFHCKLGDEQFAVAASEAMAQGIPPLEHLAARNALTSAQCAHTMASAYGIEEANPAAPSDTTLALPPGLAQTFSLRVLSATQATLSIAWPRPRPEVARRIAALFPDRSIAWLVSPGGIVATEGSHHEPRLISPAA